MDWLLVIFGEGNDLNPGQMAARALCMFVAALALIRVSGRRSFGQRTAFDACIAVLLGAVLSRGIVGASSFLGTLAAGATLVLLHRFIAWVSVNSPAFDRFVNGRERVIVREGEKLPEAMRAALISDADLDEAIRKKFGEASLQRVQRATLERGGEVSVLEKK
jgi:uncharacterized membrane protein YcaP (DUF421 family)